LIPWPRDRLPRGNYYALTLARVLCVSGGGGGGDVRDEGSERAIFFCHCGFFEESGDDDGRREGSREGPVSAKSSSGGGGGGSAAATDRVSPASGGGSGGGSERAGVIRSGAGESSPATRWPHPSPRFLPSGSLSLPLFPRGRVSDGGMLPPMPATPAVSASATASDQCPCH